MNPNVIIILLDGARGSRVRKSKDFRRLKNKGLFFSNMFTSSPYTLASLHSLFTGMFGSNNGVNGYYKINNLKTECKTLTQYLKEEGYFCVSDIMRNELCPKAGFDILEENDDYKKDKLTGYHKSLIDKTLQQSGSSPFFLFLHCSMIHTSYINNVFKVYDDFSDEYFNNSSINSKNYDSYLQKAMLYANDIYDYIDKKNILDNTLIIYHSDHGMGVGEKIGERAYGVYTYDYSIRVFCHFIYPKLFLPNSECNYLSSNVDILPTLLDILDIKSDNTKLPLDGTSLIKYINTGQSLPLLGKFLGMRERFVYSETGGLYGPWPSPDEPNVKCIRSDRWKLIHNLTPDTWELYDLHNDPLEQNDVSEENTRIFNKLKASLATFTK